MITEASIVGVFRMVLIILGVIILLRIIGQFMIAKRRMDEQSDLKKRKTEEEKERARHLKNKGKISIKKVSKDDFKDDDFTDYEEIKE